MSERLDRVVENFELRLRQGADGPLGEGEIKDRVARYAHAAASQDMQLVAVRQVLCSAGVRTILFPAYHAFSRELDRLTRQEISMDSMVREMVAKAEKWRMRGLERHVLVAIAANVYNIPLPEPPAE